MASNTAEIVINYCKSGYDLKEISKLANTSYCNVSKILRRHKIDFIPCKSPNYKGQKLTKEEVKEVIGDYLSGVRCIDLEKKHSICRAAILNILHRNGIEVRKDSIQMTDKTRNMIELYKGGLSSKEIAQKLGVRRGTVQVLVNSNGFSGNRPYYRKKHTLDDNYFECINTEKKAYHLGIFFADGNIDGHPKRNRIFISLKRQDGYLIEDFKKEIKSSAPISDKSFPKHPTWENQFCFTISSEKMKKDLIGHGCTPKKSLTAIFPNIEDEFMWHFIRGYFDGDGCIMAYHRVDCKGLMKSIIICVSEYFGAYLKDFLSEKFQIISYVRKQGNIHNLTINRQDHIIKFRDLMYKNSSIWMGRKKHKFYL